MFEYAYKNYAAYTWRANQELNMARINDFVLNCVIYLYPSKEAAKKNEPSGGSGFLFGMRSEVKQSDQESWHIYAVTNRHIIMDGSTVIRINLEGGGFDIIEKSKNDWELHDGFADLAACDIEVILGRHKVDFFVPEDMLANEVSMKELDVGIGDEVYTVGRFELAGGKLQNTPTLRFGHLARMPIEPIKSRGGLEQEVFLVDCHSVSGYSGSPVFVYLPALTPRPNRTVVSNASKTRLLGINSGHIPIANPVQVPGKMEWSNHQEGWKVVSNSAMMTVIPVWKLQELLNQERFMMSRKQDNKELEKRAADHKPLDPSEHIQEDFLSFTKEDFDQTLNMVTEKLPKPYEPEQQESKTSE